MTEFEVITTILAGISTLTTIVAVYLQVQSQKKDRRHTQQMSDPTC
jgi:hypothetical protein